METPVNEVQKDWGREVWLANTELYCAKHLHLDPGFQSSLHRHPVKDETFVVLAGECWLEFGAAMRRMLPGATQRVPPGTWHRFTNHSEDTCLILEVSTHHSDADVQRKQPSGAVQSAEVVRDASERLTRCHFRPHNGNLQSTSEHEAPSQS